MSSIFRYISPLHPYIYENYEKNLRFRTQIGRKLSQAVQSRNAKVSSAAAQRDVEIAAWRVAT